MDRSAPERIKLHIADRRPKLAVRTVRTLQREVNHAVRKKHDARPEAEAETEVTDGAKRLARGTAYAAARTARTGVERARVRHEFRRKRREERQQKYGNGVFRSGMDTCFRNDPEHPETFQPPMPADGGARFWGNAGRVRTEIAGRRVLRNETVSVSPSAKPYTAEMRERGIRRAKRRFMRKQASAGIGAYSGAHVRKNTASVAERIGKTVRDIRKSVTALRNAFAVLGGTAVLAVVFLCLAGVLFASVYGIFFSGEDSGSGRTIRDTVREIGAEYRQKLEQLRSAEHYDEVSIQGKRPEWQDVLSVYAVRYAGNETDPAEVLTLSEENEGRIRDVFWYMTEISPETETVTETETVERDDGNGNTVTEEISRESVSLSVLVSAKTAEQAARSLCFSDKQLLLLEELNSDKNKELWDLLLGVKGGAEMSEEEIWDYLMERIGNPYGVAGLMGNLQAESSLRSTNLASGFERYSGYTDETYTEDVDSGVYTRFAVDSAAYGLAQWTTESRKAALYAWAQSTGTSIGDCGMQLDFMLYELENSYPYVYSVLINASSVREASDAVLHFYEAPKNQNEAVERIRALFGLKILECYNYSY